ncbi:MAG: aminopeptidase [Bacillota bacterium]|jgi:aminopeptidase|nr:aminopeptidase [Bacillota bacterium]HOC06191.1 aminopeptidase [Bacillota bacterium]HPZ22080.1 aminopeptidase [Bacillota bacterium]HQD19858.1 aminopeptidase [Bacillota bacterium]
MYDPRIEKLAKLLIHYSLGIKKGQTLLIQSTLQAEPLMEAAYKEAILAGAHVTNLAGLPNAAEIFYKYASDEQLEYVSPLEEFITENIDARLHIMASYNTKALSGVDPQRISKNRRAGARLQTRFMERAAAGELHWTLTAYPTNAAAQDANMSLAEYTEFVFGAGLLNDEDPVARWREIDAQQEKICQHLNNCSQLRIVSKDTDISMSIVGRKWINCSGHENFPDGEVFTGPVEDSVNGHIRFSFPGIYAGKEIEDIRLEFKDGKVTKAAAAKGEDLLLALLETDAGARYVGEVAVGTNFGIQKFTRNMLFDEKIGGTVHLALGASYPESGGKNESGIHWDMLCDMRDGGEIYADGELIYKSGKFLLDL